MAPIDRIYIKSLREFQNNPRSPVLAKRQIEELDLRANHPLQKDQELKKLEVRVHLENVKSMVHEKNLKFIV